MATTKTTKTAAAKPAAPVKPGKPGVAAAPVVAAKPSAPVKPGKPALAAPAAIAPAPQAGAGTAILAKLEALATEIAALKASAAKTKATPTNVRSISEIVEGIAVAEDDWRAPYQGAHIAISRFDAAKDGTLYLLEGANGGRIEGALLALPRDSDVGGRGTDARNAGRLAVHYSRSEDGQAYHGQPAYVSVEELALIWAD